ncbi:hypothetical protein J7I98_18045 [Streptomyces sp. ISL-98]|uniref:hypothetical protein n=1 Tax=Streptomyces sp. ISL-98 TaxID=2819192 RepID=UPI001BE8859D|nr:hypothetical protein [Streptomyces sp. ISL-98]MBT2507749.1 hypothetical protein [Streptomyces sp. ISL-98]
MDLESITDELYALPPADFTAARNERVVAARKAGDRKLAGQIQALRRPTLSAWASNLLVHRQPDQVQPLISLGESMRQAHRDLDGEQLRELSRQQHALVATLARQARQLAADAGQAVSEDVQHEVEATLHAVLADAEAAQEWAAGRLIKPLSPPVGFTSATTPDSVPHKAPRPSPSPSQPTDRRARATAPKVTDQARKEQRAKLAQARQDAKTADQQALAREEELTQAETEKERAEAQLREAEEEVAALAEQLKEAKERRKAALDGAREARDRAREAATEARVARRHAQETAAYAEQLADNDA